MLTHRNNKRDIVWIFSSSKPNLIPSYVVGGILPAEYLGILQVVFLDNHNPIKFLNYYKPKIIIITKAFHGNISNLVKEAKKQKVRIISIFDDWNFILKNKIDRKKNNLNYAIASFSDTIVVKTLSASQVIKNNTGLRAEVIPDCLRFSYNQNIKKIDYPFK